jgi:hypothetical protein
MQMITKDEARRLTAQNLSWTWPNVPADVKTELHDRVNRLLADEGIPEVGDDVLSWRMSIAIRDSRHNACKWMCKSGPDEVAEYTSKSTGHPHESRTF